MVRSTFVAAMRMIGKRHALSLLLALTAGAAGAQEGTGWTFSFSPYAWFPGIDSSVSIAEGTLNADKSTSDVVADLDFALMGAVEARNGRWGLIADVVYSDLSQSEQTPLGRLFARTRVDTRMLAVSTYAGYRLFEGEQASFDLLGGLRYTELRVGLQLTPGELAGRSHRIEDDWFDPLVGARVRIDVADDWYITGLVDYGGFGGGSDASWQALGTLGYRINDRWSVQGGWRHLDIEKHVDGHDIGIDMSGPLLGLTVQF